MSEGFQKETIRVTSMNPDGSVKEDIIEVRQDPLTGHVARINISRAKRPHVKTTAVEKPDHRKKRLDCPFCMENWGKILQRYTSDFWKDGWIRKGDVVMFPNKFPFSKHHSVLILGGEHRDKLSSINMQTWKDAFLVVQTYFKRVLEYECWDAAYPYINLNFLSPSGASIDHPHMQILVEHKPLNAHRDLLERSNRFFHRKKVSYWKWLKNNHPEELLIKKSRDMYIVASFAPLANGEVVGMGLEKPLIEFSRSELNNLAEHVGRVLWGFEKIGTKSMNLTVAFPKDEKEAEYFPTLMRIIIRPMPELLYTADRGFVEIFYRESVVHTLPESIASSLRRVLG